MTSYTSPAITSSTYAINNETFLDAWGASIYRMAKYLIQVVDFGYTPNLVQVAEILVFHDNNGASTVVDITNYGVSSNFGELGEFNAEYSAGLITLNFTPYTAPINMVIRLTRTAMII